MRVVTFGNEKGGVGKTTICITTAAGLAIRGYRVALIDTDGQGNASMAFGMKKEPGFYDLVVRNAKWNDILRVVPKDRYSANDSKGTLLLCPGNDETRGIPGNVSDGFILLKRIMQLQEIVDFILIDTMPTPSLIHSLVHAATREYIYVTMCEQWSIDGLSESFQRLEAFNPFRINNGLEPVRVLGVLPTMYRKNTVEHEETLRELHEALPDMVLPPMADRIAWAESARMRKAIFATHPDSKAAEEAWEIIDHVEGVKVNG